MIENTLVLNRDERLGDGEVSFAEAVLSSNTIAAIVTSLGGPPGAVGIVRLSGPSAVPIAGKVFRPMSRKSRKDGHWWPNSHVVEYGEVLDSCGNVIDEVLLIEYIMPFDKFTCFSLKKRCMRCLGGTGKIFLFAVFFSSWVNTW